MPTPHKSLSPYTAFAVAAPGLAPLLADELRGMSIVVDNESPAGVLFAATDDTLMQVNLWSRLASRVVIRLAEFTARDFATLEKQGARVPWASVVSPGAQVRFRVTCRKSRLYHSDAVAERLARSVLQGVPSAVILDRAQGDDDGEDAAVAEQLIMVRFDHDVCVISADSSGDLLHRRGWRQAIAKAPLRETLAAAMLKACGRSRDEPLVDPFCGSGTIGIEAALRARNMAPGLNRAFAMEQWPGMDRARLVMQRAAARASVLPSAGARIVMSDRDAGACAAALSNAARAGVANDVEIVQRSLSDTDLGDVGVRGMVITNPPYGQRVSDGADLRGLYSRLGEVIRAGGPAWQLAFLVPDRRFAQQTGLQFDSVLKTSNGGINVSVERSLDRNRDRRR